MCVSWRCCFENLRKDCSVCVWPGHPGRQLGTSVQAWAEPDSVSTNQKVPFAFIFLNQPIEEQGSLVGSCTGVKPLKTVSFFPEIFAHALSHTYSYIPEINRIEGICCLGGFKQNGAVGVGMGHLFSLIVCQALGRQR